MGSSGFNKQHSREPQHNSLTMGSRGDGWASLLLVLMLGVLVQGDIKCHYCGVKNLCELPYDLATAEFINCPKSCMKFDGFADGKKVIVRDCGIYEADECTQGDRYENTEAEGDLCHCMGEKCNRALASGPYTLYIVLLPTIMVIFHTFYST